MKIKATIDGVEQEFEVLRMQIDNGPATHALDNGCIRKAPSVITTNPTWLRLIRPRHTFGGVVFEEVGENRPPKPGEWFLEGANRDYIACYSLRTDYTNRTILRHVCEAPE